MTETVSEMSNKGVKRALGLIMAAHQCDASWQRYQRDVEEAIVKTGVQLSVDYTPPIFDHPLFIETASDHVNEYLTQIPHRERERAVLVFTAHSISTPMADESPYVKQLTTSSRLIAERLRHEHWMLACQSRSGRPTDPWLEPNICDVIRDPTKQGVRYVIVQPIRFLCDNVEVLYDIGIEAVQVAKEVGISLLHARTVNDDPKFIAALADVIERYIKDDAR